MEPQAPRAPLAPEEPSPVTITHDAHVLVVVAVVDAPAVAPALAQRRLPALAVHVVQEDGPAALPEGHGRRQGDGVAAAQLAAHHVGVHDVPVVVAHRAPRAVVEDLQAALAAAGPVGQAQLCEDGHSEVLSGLARRQQTPRNVSVTEVLGPFCPESPLLGSNG